MGWFLFLNQAFTGMGRPGLTCCDPGFAGITRAEAVDALDAEENWHGSHEGLASR